MSVEQFTPPQLLIDSHYGYKPTWYTILKTISDNSLPAEYKVFMETLFDYFALKEFDSEGFVSVYYGEGAASEGLTGKTGFSRFAVARMVKKLDEAGIIRRRCEVDKYDKKHILLAPTALFYDPANCRLSSDRTWGGKRVRCPYCKSNKVTAYVGCTCDDCHRDFQVVGDVHIVKGRPYYDDRPIHSFWDDK